jgi:hypothetical protein
MLEELQQEVPISKRPPPQLQKAESDNGISPSIIYDNLGDTPIATNLEAHRDMQREPTLASKNYAEPFSTAEVAANVVDSLALQPILVSKGITDAKEGIDSESPPVPAQDADNTTEQVTDLKETQLSSRQLQ